MRISQLPTRDTDDETTRLAGDELATQLVSEQRTRATAAGPEALDSAPTRHGGGAADEQALVLGRYQLSKPLGTGAFGTVFAARDERLDRDVAVKVLPRERVVHARFEREARAAARLAHPAIVTLYEAAVDDHGAYLVSELVRGRTLDRLLAQGKLSDRDILEIGTALCDALTHAHAQGVIHRDVKPSNVLVPNRPNGASGRAKLTDFGVAQVVGGESLTRTGDVIGTLAYMAPEQAQGRDVGPAADLYSVALVIYEALAGVNPLREQAGRRGRAVVFVPPLRRQRRDIHRELAAAIDRALRPRQSERGSLEDLHTALAQSIELADDTAGVVAGWSDVDADDDELGPEWREQPTRLRLTGGVSAERASAWRSEASQLPDWWVRGLNAAAAGLSAAWLAGHLLHSVPLAPAEIALIATGLTLLLPRLGWAAVLTVVAALAAGQGRAAGAATLLLVSMPAVALLCRRRDGAALPGGAVALGLVGLAGAWPFLVGRALPSWWQRAVVGASGFVWLGVASALVGHNLYWAPAGAPVSHVWLGSTHAAVSQLLEPTVRSGALLGALVWAVIAALLPWLTTRRSALLDLVISVVLALGALITVQATGARPLHGAALATILATLIAAYPTLFALAQAVHEHD